MRRVALGMLVLALGLVASLAAVAPAHSAGVFIEPELGGRWISADWKSMMSETGIIYDPYGNPVQYSMQGKGNILGPGVTVGGTLGFHLAPMIALVGHIDVGFHGAPEDVKFTLDVPGYGSEIFTDQIVESGASLIVLAGARIYPMADAPGPLSPYIGASAGIGSIAWTYKGDYKDTFPSETDGIGAFLLCGEAGADFRVSSNIAIGVGGRLIYHSWASKTVEDFEVSDLAPVSFSANGHLGFHF